MGGAGLGEDLEQTHMSPPFGKRKIIDSNMPYQGDMLVAWRAFETLLNIYTNNFNDSSREAIRPYLDELGVSWYVAQ